VLFGNEVAGIAVRVLIVEMGDALSTVFMRERLGWRSRASQRWSGSLGPTILCRGWWGWPRIMCGIKG
jgi:hypothetical protein